MLSTLFDLSHDIKTLRLHSQVRLPLFFLFLPLHGPIKHFSLDLLTLLQPDNLALIINYGLILLIELLLQEIKLFPHYFYLVFLTTVGDGLQANFVLVDHLFLIDGLNYLRGFLFLGLFGVEKLFQDLLFCFVLVSKSWLVFALQGAFN